MEKLVKFDSASPGQGSDCIDNSEEKENEAHESGEDRRTFNEVSTHRHPHGIPEDENSQCDDKTGDEKVFVVFGHFLLPFRLMKNAHLRRFLHPSSLQRTFKYASGRLTDSSAWQYCRSLFVATPLS